MKITVKQLRSLIKECLNEDTDWDADDSVVQKNTEKYKRAKKAFEHAQSKFPNIKIVDGYQNEYVDDNKPITGMWPDGDDQQYDEPQAYIDSNGDIWEYSHIDRVHHKISPEKFIELTDKEADDPNYEGEDTRWWDNDSSASDPSIPDYVIGELEKANKAR